MILDDCRHILADALPLRVPRFDPEHTARQKVEALEDYLLTSAHTNGALVEARHFLRLIEAQLEDEWEKLDGWGNATTKPRAKLTKQDIHEAKLKTSPAKYEALLEVRQVRASVDDQIVRFEREERVVSRAYTMVTGG